MLEREYRIVNGYGNLKNSTFRIGHMGEVTIKQLEAMLNVLTEVILKNKKG
jgi:aspartate aminotransferase-like enzyme